MGPVATSLDAEGAVANRQGLDRGGNILGTGGHHHAPRGQSSASRPVQAETVFIGLSARKVDFAVESFSTSEAQTLHTQPCQSREQTTERAQTHAARRAFRHNRGGGSRSCSKAEGVPHVVDGKKGEPTMSVVGGMLKLAQRALIYDERVLISSSRI